MLDGPLRPFIDPPLAALARPLSRAGIRADAITLAGLAASLACAGFIWAGLHGAALVALVLSRLADGLDGAVARAQGRTDFGAWLDIVCDFVFYGAVPLAFGLADPANAMAALTLLFAFYVNAAGFLAFAALAGKRGWETQRAGAKGFYFSAGLAEGAETILAFAAMMLWPDWFAAIAYAFAALCAATVIGRLALALKLLR